MPGDSGTAYPGIANKAVSSRGLTTEPRLQKVVDDALGASFFRDLVDEQASSPIDPLSPQRVREIKSRWGIDARNVRDPEAEAAALLGFEVVLSIATFFPATALPATAFLLLLALAKGDRGEAVFTAATFPLGAAGRLGLLAQKLARLGKALKLLRFAPKTIEDYRILARLLFKAAPNLERLVAAIRPVVSKRELNAVKTASRVYNETLKRTKDVAAAQRAAGSAYHTAVGAAGAGEGVDKVMKGGKVIVEIKTHYVPMLDRLVVNKGNDAVLAYVLKDLLEKGAVRKGLVEHVFIDPKKGTAVKLVVDALDGKQIMDLLR